MSSLHRQAGFGSVFLLLVIVLGAIGAGAWNYHRNLELERASRAARPLSGYSTEDLEALAEAYRSEVAARSARYDGAKGQRAEARERAYFDQQVQEFEKVQRQAGKTRDAGGELAVREAALRDVEAELATRGSDATSEWQIHWKRLTDY
jgi:hypothetical protein